MRGLFLVVAATALCARYARGQTVATVDVYFTEDNWNEAARPKDKSDGNDYVDMCIRVQNGEWTKAEAKRKGSSTWQPMGMKASLKIKKIESKLNFADRFESDKVVLNNDIKALGYADGYRVYREMGVVAPEAYFAIVRMYRTSNMAGGCDSVNDNDLVLADGPHRYTVTQSIAAKDDFLNPNFGNCAWAQYEIETGTFEFKRSPFESDDTDCLDMTSRQKFAEDLLDSEELVLHERVRMKQLRNWHMPSLTKYIATDAIIGHRDGPTLKNNNGYVVRSTIDLDCTDANNADACSEGGLYYVVPHGIDHTVECERYGDFNIVNDIWGGGETARILPIDACGADARCKEDVMRAYARGLESAHKTISNCYGFQLWNYFLIVVGTVLVLSVVFACVRRPGHSEFQPKHVKVYVGVDVILRVVVFTMLLLMWLPVPVYESGDRSPFTHYWLERTAEFPTVRDGIPALVTSADYDLISDWQGSLERLAWASALRYDGRVDTRWYYDEPFGYHIKNLYPNEITRDEYGYDGKFGRSSIDAYTSACTTRNKCCHVHRYFLGNNIAVFTLFLVASVITIVRGALSIWDKRVWSILDYGALFVIGLKLFTCAAFVIGMTLYYWRNMQGYYCDGEAYDDFDDSTTTVHYGMLFWFGVVVCVLLAVDTGAEVAFLWSSGKTYSALPDDSAF